MSEKLCLRWNDFKDNAISAFASLREDKDFADVTLACEDGQQFEAHKVVLASLSPVFKNLLMKNKHPHPLIYMRGVRSEDLLAVIDFLYCGEANVYQENLDSFFAISEELELKGLSVKNEGCAIIQREDVKKSVTKKVKPVQKKKEANVLKSPSFPDQDSSFEGQILANELDFTMPVTNPLSEDFQELDEKCKSMMEKTLKKQANGYPLYMCKVCGKEEIKSGMTKHIESNHVEGLSVPCNFCEKIFR